MTHLVVPIAPDEGRELGGDRHRVVHLHLPSSAPSIAPTGIRLVG